MPGGAADNVGDGVHDPGRGREDGSIVVVAAAARWTNVHRVGRLADDLDAVRPAGLSRLRPVRSQVTPQPGDVLDDDHRFALDHALDLEAQCRNGALGDVSRRDVEVLRRGLLFDGVRDLVDLDPEPGRELSDGGAQAMLRTPGKNNIGKSPSSLPKPMTSNITVAPS